MRVCFFLFFYDFYLYKAQLYPLRTTDVRQSHLRYLSLCFLRFLRLPSDFNFRFFLNRQRGFTDNHYFFAVRCTPCGGRPAGVRAIVSGGRPGVRVSGDRLTPDGISPAAVRASGSARTRSGAEAVRNLSLIPKHFERDQISPGRDRQPPPAIGYTVTPHPRPGSAPHPRPGGQSRTPQGSQARTGSAAAG